MKTNLGIIFIVISTLLVLSTAFYFGTLELVLIRGIIAIILTATSYILLMSSKISKKDAIRILSPYWTEYLKSNYVFERKLQMQKFVRKHKSFSTNLYYLYVCKKTTMDFWKFSKACAEGKEHLSEDAWGKYLNEYLDNTLGFPEREIRLLLAFEISKFIDIDR